MNKILIIILLLFIGFIYGQRSIDEIEILNRNSEQYVCLPHNIYKNENLWYSGETNGLFTGRIEIFISESQKTKVAECTIIKGMKNGYFKQYYNKSEMLPGITGLYVNDKREGTWTWVEPEGSNKNRTWIDSNIRLITNIDYRNGIKNGTIIVHKATLIQNVLLERLSFSVSDINLKGEFDNGQRSGEWLFNDHISTNHDILIESIYSSQLSLHWTRKEIYDNDMIVDRECREPWDRYLDCDSYKSKYSNQIYLIPDRNIQEYESSPMRHSTMAMILDAQGNEVEVDIVHFMEHINEFHSKNTSIHKESGNRFLINDDFRRILNEKYWE